jgi:hypothetical protein
MVDEFIKLLVDIGIFLLHSPKSPFRLIVLDYVML